MATAKEIYEIAKSPRPASLQLDVLRGWLIDPDAEVRGAAYTLVRERPDFPWSPPLDEATLDGLVRGYLEERIRKNEAAGEWALSRYEAAWELAAWIAHVWFGTGTPPGDVGSLVQSLAGLYREGDESLRRALVDGTLEHLFEREDIKAAFSDWKVDPELSRAYDEAVEWSAHGGTSHLVGSARRGKADGRDRKR